MNPDGLYHIYNRGINSEVLFREPGNFNYFLKKLYQYLSPVADVYAYCLMKEHFHLCVHSLQEEEIRNNLNLRYWPGTIPEQSASWIISNHFGTLFKSYAQYFNKAFNRTGGLFEEPFRRIEIEQDDLCWLINHIHTNPLRHGISDSFTDYAHSSYSTLLTDEYTMLNRDLVISAFGDSDNFISFHQQPIPEAVFNRISMD